MEAAAISTPERLAAFREWLGRSGVSMRSRHAYANEAAKSLATSGGFLGRLQDVDLTPKTRHRVRSTGIRWAAFANDAGLARELGEFKLPKAKRASAKTPIGRAQLHLLVDEVCKSDDVKPAIRAVICMMACRGFRISDVLGMRRTELRSALDTNVLAFSAKGDKRMEFPMLETFSAHVEDLANTAGDWVRVENLVSTISARAAAAPDKEIREILLRKAAAAAVTRALRAIAARCGIGKMPPHRLRRTYAVEYLRSLEGNPEAIAMLTEHMQWESMNTAMEYIDHSRGGKLDDAARRIFER